MFCQKWYRLDRSSSVRCQHESAVPRSVRAGAIRAAGQALKRIAQPDDVGDVIAFLASDSARWITGDTIRVDGGSKL